MPKQELRPESGGQPPKSQAEHGDTFSFEWDFETGGADRPGTGLPPVAGPKGGHQRDYKEGGRYRAVNSPAAVDPPQPEANGHRVSTRDAEEETGRYKGREGGMRARYVRHLLDNTLDRWWRDGEVPPQALLREGLLVLAAGHPLEDAHRSLLLRGALLYRRGMLTALRFQTDPERTALLLKEAALAWDPPVTPDTLIWLRAHDPAAARWLPAFSRELEAEALAGQVPREGRAMAVLAALQPQRHGDSGVRLEMIGNSPARPHRWFLRVVVAAALVLILAGFAWWQFGGRPGGEEVAVAGGSYMVRDSTTAEEDRTVQLGAFFIDRFEVTNGAYQRCVRRQACPRPAEVRSATRESYFIDPAMERYPVVYVDWGAANSYCAWMGKRLPTAEEWEVAAGFAPATVRRQRFPWGDAFAPQRTNSGEGAPGDTAAVGSYRPGGDSPSGGVDMAGNVAEWTSTWVRDGEAGYVAKGGSFRSGADVVAVSAQSVNAPELAADWLGFRCARTR